MPEHTEPDERQRHAFAEKDFADQGRDFGEGISYTSNDKVLE